MSIDILILDVENLKKFAEYKLYIRKLSNGTMQVYPYTMGLNNIINIILKKRLRIDTLKQRLFNLKVEYDIYELYLYQ